VNDLHVVPSLLEERCQEVEGHNDVLSELLIGHLGVADGDVEVGDLLELPLDGGFHIFDFLGKWLVVRHWLWESTNSVKDWTEDNWDLLNEGIGGEEEIVFLGPSLNDLLILVEFLQAFKVSNING